MSRRVEPAKYGPTAFPELNGLLKELVDRTWSTVGDGFFGAYLTGSFALGAADLSSDCDFIIVLRDALTPDQEAAIRSFHDEVPTRPGHWTQNLEGSYAPLGDLETPMGLGKKWPYIDRGWRDMQWSTHCNTEDVRWTLRERGITLAGPNPHQFVAEVPADALRRMVKSSIGTFLPDLLAWTSFEIAWTQRYAVETIARMLYTLETGEVESKRTSLEWAKRNMSSEWSDLIQQVVDDRPVGWDPDDPPRPGSVEATLAFVDYARELAGTPQP